MEPAIVVSGHPRSGTSMMMRMLHLGGMQMIAEPPTLKEGRPGNIYGTFEIKDFDWLVEHPEKAAGNCFKIVTRDIKVLEVLINKCELPMKVLFMVRPMQDIVASMIEHSLENKYRDMSPPDSIALGRKVLTHYDVPTLNVNYNDAIDYPKATCLQVIDFIGKDLDLEAMIAAIDPEQRHFYGG